MKNALAITLIRVLAMIVVWFGIRAHGSVLDAWAGLAVIRLIMPQVLDKT